VDIHANGGIEINFDDSDRSRARYAGGVTLRLIEQVAFLVDVVGSSNIQTDRVSTKFPQYILAATPNARHPLQSRAQLSGLNCRPQRWFQDQPVWYGERDSWFATVFIL